MDWRTVTACAAGVLLGTAAWIALPGAAPRAAGAPSGPGPDAARPGEAPSAAGRSLRFLLMDGCPGCETLRPELEAARSREDGVVLADACEEPMERLAERLFRRDLHGAILLDEAGEVRWSAEGHDGMRKALTDPPSRTAGGAVR